MKIYIILSIIILITSISYSQFSQELSPEQHEVWLLEEVRAEYVNSRDVENFRAMYHEFQVLPTARRQLNAIRYAYKLIQKKRRL